MLQANKNVISSCSHCSYSIIVLILYSFDTQAMLMLILIVDVQYLQNVVFRFESSKSTLRRFSPPVKKFSPAKISIPAGGINPHLTAIWKTLVMNILKIYKYINILETKIFIIIYYTYIIITPTVEFRSESYYNYVF